MGEMVAFGKYRVVEKRPAQGSWIVYDVVEVAHDRKAQLRVYSNRIAEGSEREKSFLDTINRIAEIDHPHVVNVWDFGTALEKGFYTVPPRDAVPLHETIAEGGLTLLDEVELLEAATKLCSGLQALHDAGLTHGAISKETVYWDRRRCFPFLGWLPVISGTPEELRLTLSEVPKSYQGKSEDIFRLAEILHEMLMGATSAPLDQANEGSLARDQGGAIDGVFPVLHKALALDAEETYESVASLSKALEKVLSKQRVRAELEKSVSSMVIPQEILEAALKKKKEQKRRKQQEAGAPPTSKEQAEDFMEAIRANPLPVGGGVAAFLCVFLFFVMGDSSPAPQTPRRRPSKSRPALKRPPKTTTSSGVAPVPKPRSAKPKTGAEAVLALKNAKPTEANTFMERWKVLKSWVLSLPPRKRRNLFKYGKLLRLRSELKKDEYGACRKLDELIQQAVSSVD